MDFSSASDLELMARVQQRDAAAFAALYQRYARQILNFFYHMAFDAAQCEDLMQDVFVKLWQNAAQFQGRGAFRAWLFQIAKHHWLNVLDKKSRRPAAISLTQCPEATTVAARGAVTAGGDVDGAADNLQRAVRQALQRLPVPLQLTFTLAHFQQLPYRDIAAILDIPLGTVKSRVAAAERHLRQSLRAYWKDTRSC